MEGPKTAAQEETARMTCASIGHFRILDRCRRCFLTLDGPTLEERLRVTLEKRTVQVIDSAHYIGSERWMNAYLLSAYAVLSKIEPAHRDKYVRNRCVTKALFEICPLPDGQISPCGIEFLARELHKIDIFSNDQFKRIKFLSEENTER